MYPIVVLAGGLATRLRPVTEKIPKSMILINGKPFIYHQLELFKSKSIKKIHFCLGYLGEDLKKYIEKNYSKDFELSFSFDGDTLLGTGGAILKAFPFLPEVFQITYGDSYLDIDYNSICECFQEYGSQRSGLMTIYKNEGRWDSSNVLFLKNKISLYSKRNKLPGMNFIDYGLGILNKSNFDKWENIGKFDLAEIYESLSIEGNLIGYEVSQRFYEVGSFSGIDDISNYLKQK